MLDHGKNQKQLYEKILDLSYRSAMTRAQIAVRLGLDIGQVDQALLYDRAHDGAVATTETDLYRIFAA